MMELTRNEDHLARTIAAINEPQNYREVYKHMANCGVNRGNLSSENWINKMTAHTIKLYEAMYVEPVDDFLEILVDAKLKHSS